MSVADETLDVFEAIACREASAESWGADIYCVCAMTDGSHALIGIFGRGKEFQIFHDNKTDKGKIYFAMSEKVCTFAFQK